MRRRNFIASLASTTAAWSVVARAQQPERVRRIGFLSPTVGSDPQYQTWIRDFTQRLEEFGWTSGRNVRIDLRFSGADATRMEMLATELEQIPVDFMRSLRA